MIQKTSRDAFDASKSKTKQMEHRILHHLEGCGEGGATDEEMDIAFGTEKTRSNRPTRHALTKRGRIVKSGRTRKTQSGRAAIVWILKEHAGWDTDAGTRRDELLKLARRKIKEMSDEELEAFVGEKREESSSDFLDDGDLFALFGGGETL